MKTSCKSEMYYEFLTAGKMSSGEGVCTTVFFIDYERKFVKCRILVSLMVRM